MSLSPTPVKVSLRSLFPTWSSNIIYIYFCKKHILIFHWGCSADRRCAKRCIRLELVLTLIFLISKTINFHCYQWARYCRHQPGHLDKQYPCRCKHYRSRYRPWWWWTEISKEGNGQNYFTETSGFAGARTIASIATNRRMTLGRYREGRSMKAYQLESCQQPQYRYKKATQEHFDIRITWIGNLMWPHLTRCGVTM